MPSFLTKCLLCGWQSVAFTSELAERAAAEHLALPTLCASTPGMVVIRGRVGGLSQEVRAFG